DSSDKMPGWKFSEYEMKGVPLRLEIGPRDLEKNQCVAVRRDTGEKTIVSLDSVESDVQSLLDQVHDTLYQRALQSLDNRISNATSWQEFVDAINSKPGFVRAMWCGDAACEQKIKDETGATSRCMPFDQEAVAATCVCCGKPADKLVIWGKAY
ncbi:MAG: His/Gly/Thr/Pro-type tRNA ligase C-terminal domain-containing protein, partial [Bacillota bacterium]|nr:His/Gly/Thr/Pro-type tRNA ligase C-terminal domain-containing protein [Bacillota bacterium]